MDRETKRYFSGVALGGLTVLAAVMVVMVLFELRTVLAVLFLGVIIGVALTPVAEWLNRFYIPKAIAVLLVYFTIAAALAGFAWYAAVELAAEFDEMTDEISRLLERYDRYAEERGLPGTGEAQTWIEDNGPGVFGDALTRALGAIAGLVYVFTIFVVALFFTITKDRLRELILSLLDDPQRAKTEDLMNKIGYKLRRFMLGELAAMTIVGGLTYIGLLVLGIRFPLVLAAMAFLFELLPMVGPWIAFVPAFGVALTQGIVPAIQVAILYFAIQQIESYIVIPLVQGREVEMPGLLIIISIIIGGALMGVIGALLALPVALIAHTIFFEVFVPWRRGKIDEAVAKRNPLPLILRPAEKDDGAASGS